MTVGFDTHAVDFEVALSEYGPITRLVLRPQVIRLFAVLGLVAAVTALGTLAFYQPPGGAVWVVGALLLAAGFTALVGELAILRLRLAIRRAPDRFPTGPHRVSVGPAGFQVSANGVESHVRWARVERLDRHHRYLLLRLSTSAAMQVPRAAFRTAADERAFVDAVLGWLRDHDAESSPVDLPAIVDDPKAIHVTFRLEVDDYVAFLHFTRWANRTNRYVFPLLAIGVLALCTLTTLGLWSIGEPFMDLVPFMVLAAGALLLSVMPLWGGALTTWLARRRVRGRPRQYSLAERQLHLGPQGLYATWEGGDGALEWSRISRIAAHRGQTFLMMGEHSALIVPDRAVPDPVSFRSRAQDWLSRDQIRRRDPAAPPPPADMTNPFAPPRSLP